MYFKFLLFYHLIQKLLIFHHVKSQCCTHIQYVLSSDLLFLFFHFIISHHKLLMYYRLNKILSNYLLVNILHKSLTLNVFINFINIFQFLNSIFLPFYLSNWRKPNNLNPQKNKQILLLFNALLNFIFLNLFQHPKFRFFH